MAQVPGLPADVFFGDTAKPLPNWREHANEPADGDDDYPESSQLSEEEHASLVGRLVFDPDELFADDAEES